MWGALYSGFLEGFYRGSKGVGCSGAEFEIEGMGLRVLGISSLMYLIESLILIPQGQGIYGAS